MRSMAAEETLLERIEQAIGPTVAAMGFEFVLARFVGGRPKTLQIMAEPVDGPGDIDAYADLSRAVSAILDVEDLIAGEYVLEVSSPGLDRPLVKKADFERHVGSRIKLRLNEAQGDRRNFKGRLCGVIGDMITIAVGQGQGEEVFKLPLANIGEANLVVNYDLIRADLKKAKAKET